MGKLLDSGFHRKDEFGIAEAFLNSVLRNSHVHISCEVSSAEDDHRFRRRMRIVDMEGVI